MTAAVEISRPSAWRSVSAYREIPMSALTYLNLDKPYPRQVFTILIWSEYRSLYRRAPEKLFRGKTVCVKGRISTYNGTPQIIARQSKVWIPKNKTVTVSKSSRQATKAPGPRPRESGPRLGYFDYYDHLYDDYYDDYYADLADRAIEVDIDRMMDEYDAWIDDQIDPYLDRR